MSAAQKNHQDAIALSNLAHRSMDALEHEFVILSELILKQTSVSTQLEKELKHVKLGIHDLTKGKLSPFILSLEILPSSLRQVQDILSNQFTQYHISHIDPPIITFRETSFSPNFIHIYF